jgi:hypothetical protein
MSAAPGTEEIGDMRLPVLQQLTLAFEGGAQALNDRFEQHCVCFRTPRATHCVTESLPEAWVPSTTGGTSSHPNYIVAV